MITRLMVCRAAVVSFMLGVVSVLVTIEDRRNTSSLIPCVVAGVDGVDVTERCMRRAKNKLDGDSVDDGKAHDCDHRATQCHPCRDCPPTTCHAFDFPTTTEAVDRVSMTTSSPQGDFRASVV
ncbi:MAG: hypothetical protein KDJ37_13665 [Hyphomicrobiaceae bacterium]|nr:hypothetical protein [Hyphomicrobiaceae bacterium]